MSKRLIPGVGIVDTSPRVPRLRHHEFRAYDTTTEWSGPVRESAEAAARDAERHNKGLARQGGYGSAIVVMPDPEAPGRLADLTGVPVWPPHGRSTGAARWRT